MFTRGICLLQRRLWIILRDGSFNCFWAMDTFVMIPRTQLHNDVVGKLSLLWGTVSSGSRRSGGFDVDVNVVKRACSPSLSCRVHELRSKPHQHLIFCDQLAQIFMALITWQRRELKHNTQCVMVFYTVAAETHRQSGTACSTVTSYRLWVSATKSFLSGRQGQTGSLNHFAWPSKGVP